MATTHTEVHEEYILNLCKFIYQDSEALTESFEMIAKMREFFTNEGTNKKIEFGDYKTLTTALAEAHSKLVEAQTQLKIANKIFYNRKK